MKKNGRTKLMEDDGDVMDVGEVDFNEMMMNEADQIQQQSSHRYHHSNHNCNLHQSNRVQVIHH